MVNVKRGRGRAAGVILKSSKLQTVHIAIQNGSVQYIREEENILKSLSKLGMDLKPILCGGNIERIQKREQWHSGANFFAMGPGKVIGYGRNEYTVEEMNKGGFSIINAQDVITDKIDLNDYSKYLVTINGSELSRGGGGYRCMTMPVRRKSL